MSQSVCPHCGGAEIVTDIRLIEGESHREVGLSYQVQLVFKALIANAAEPLLADLCTSCGTVTRFHVANTKRTWK